MTDEKESRARWRRGLFWGTVLGTFFGIYAFGICVFVAGLVVNPASLSVSFQPWWRVSNWIISVLVFLVAGVMAGLSAAFEHPVRKRKS